MLVIGFISFKTCSLYVIHMKPGEHEPDVIERILGKKWKNAFCIGSALLMFIVGVVYFLLINNNLYAMITSIMYWCNNTNY